ncbi:MAG: hypothetical protein KDA99_28325, partial [Planctomycetales bacterium]|nr:hypothetical protein [Planctomycetales bacterium]
EGERGVQDRVSGFATGEFVCQCDAYTLRWRGASFLLIVQRHTARWVIRITSAGGKMFVLSTSIQFGTERWSDEIPPPMGSILPV